MSKKKNKKTVNTATIEKEGITMEKATEKTQAEVAKKYDVEVVKEPSIGEKISDGVDTVLAWARRNWRKLAVAAVGVATAVALPAILDKRNAGHEDTTEIDDIPFVEDNDEQEETVEEQRPEEEPAVEE